MIIGRWQSGRHAAEAMAGNLRAGLASNASRRWRLICQRLSFSGRAERCYIQGSGSWRACRRDQAGSGERK
jgi:hypothetical protein